MSVPELDLKKVNLQAAVGYLISLHDNEVDWNLLGIKVIGAIDALPIPEGTYEYGDAYMVGTETPYDMYIYTRPDGEVHTEGYWFPIGKFPVPGPKGDKGDGWEQINTLSDGSIKSLAYYPTSGADITSNALVSYKDSTTGEGKTQQFTMFSKLPIIPGKYISMNATSDNKKMEVKVDDTALALDYVKINKTLAQDSTFAIEQGKPVWYQTTQFPIARSFAWRNDDGDCRFNKLYVDRLATTANEYDMPLQAAYYGGFSDGFTVEKTPTDTGTLTAVVMDVIQAYPNAGLKYDNQSYVRMDPQNAPNGTLNFIHLDSIDDGNGGYKATGKCFSITVSTREWKVIDLNFGGQTTHNLLITDNNSGNGYYFQLATNQSAAYTTADVRTIIAEVKGKIIPCVFRQGTDSDKKFYSGILQASDAGFSCYYGDQNMDFGMTPTQVTVRDNV